MPTRRLFVSTIKTLLLLLCLPAPGTAGEVDPLLRTPPPDLVLPAAKDGEQRLPVTVEFAAAPDGVVPAGVLKAGFRPLKAGGRAVCSGRFCNGSIGLSDLDRLADVPGVRRIETALGRGRRPMNRARPVNGIDEAYGWRGPDGSLLDGSGVRICVDDTRVDIFHPFFFRPDGGLFTWIDVDGSGGFEPGIDAVDLDGNGVAGPEEGLRFFDARVDDDPEAVGTIDGLFQPRLDYLYNDRDGDERRGFGPGDGFIEADPSYGERLFVTDDENGNGRLDPGERLTGLGSSKVAVAYTYTWGDEEILVWRRGENLIDYPFAPESGISHGTGTAGIAAGGWPGHPLHGVAPGAELVLVDSTVNSSYQYDPYGERFNLTAGLALCEEGGARIALHEWCVNSPQPLDGSSAAARAMAEAAGRGIVQINPTCNYHGSKKIARLLVPPRETLEFGIVEDPVWPGMAEYRYLSVSLRWRDPDRPLSIDLLWPDGEWHKIRPGYEQPFPGVWQIASIQTSPRGTVSFESLLFVEEGQPPLAPPFSFRILNLGQTPLDVHGFATDEQAHFYYGLIFDRAATDNGPGDWRQSTISLPAAADDGVGVAAHEHLDGTGLAYFSGRGLRIDGRQVVSVSGTHTQFAPAARQAGETATDGFLMFGGTSSSSPLLAGITALLLQYAPDLDAFGVGKAIRDGSDATGLSGRPDPGWGWGRVWVPGLLAAADRALTDEQPPAASIWSDPVGIAGRRFVFSAAGSLDDRRIVAWTWDTGDPAGPAPDEPLDLPWLIHTYAVPGTYRVTLEVEDESGSTSTAVRTVTVIDRAGDYPLPVDSECHGPCNGWQVPVCVGAHDRCLCLSGDWTRIDCAAVCGSSGTTPEPCQAGTAAGDCLCVAVDGDAGPDGDAEPDVVPDGDAVAGDGDDEAGEVGDGDSGAGEAETADGDGSEAETGDGESSPIRLHGAGGCAGGQEPALLLVLSVLAAVLARRRL